MKIGCTRCPYAGHIELRECIDAYTEVAEHCGAYNHNELEGSKENDRESKQTIIEADKEE